MSDQDLEKVDSGRRDFLKKSIVAGAVVWGAPAVTSLPGGRAWAQTYGECSCNGDAYGLRLIIPALGLDQTLGVDGSLVNVSPIAIPVVGGSVAATAVTGLDGSSVNGACFGRASVATLDLQVGPALAPILTVAASIITADASASCPPCATSGQSSIANLVVNGITVNATSACNNDVLNLGLVVINQQSCDAEGNLTVNAIHITVPGIIEVIVSHAVAGAGDGAAGGSDCPCVACA
ncbi:MAG: choice-of-anchor P family protein [Actinomycetota bacterium]